MHHSSYRNQITTGVLTLPVTTGIATLIWLMPDGSDLHRWLGLLLTGSLAFLLSELNNRNALIRTRSQMVGTTFMALLAPFTDMHDLSEAMIPTACLILSYFQLFSTYQRPRPEGQVFTSFLLLGIACWFYPLLLCFVPVVYTGLLIPLRALTWRTCFAGIFGLLLPFWGYAGYAIGTDRAEMALQPFTRGVALDFMNFSTVPTGVLAGFLLMTLLAVCSMLHFSYTAYGDKIRTRMFYYVIISIEIFLFGIFLLQPAGYRMSLSLLAANSAPLIAHHFTLGKGRLLDGWFLVCLLALAVLTLFNTLDLWTLL